MFRIYDKQPEQNEKLVKEGKSPILHPWVRWEMELKQERAQEACKRMMQGSSINEVAIGILSNYLRIIEPDNERKNRIFLRWVYREYGLSFNPAKIKVPKSPKKIVHIYTDTEIQFLFSCIQTSVPRITARNSAIIALMLDSGIRQKEVCELQKADIDKERMLMKVTGKGAKDRLVPLGYISSLFLDDYLSQCPYSNTAYVFVDRLGRPLSGNAVRVFVNRLQKKLPFDLSSHKLRHNFAANYCVDNLRKNGNSCVYDLSILMGHESMETTKKYEHFAHELLAVEDNHSHLDKVFQV